MIKLLLKGLRRHAHWVLRVRVPSSSTMKALIVLRMHTSHEGLCLLLRDRLVSKSSSLILISLNFKVVGVST